MVKFARTAERVGEKAGEVISHNQGGSLEKLSCGFTGKNEPE
jgi:hypothetical protein